jgi:hypothetical protein
VLSSAEMWVAYLVSSVVVNGDLDVERARVDRGCRSTTH